LARSCRQRFGCGERRRGNWRFDHHDTLDPLRLNIFVRAGLRVHFFVARHLRMIALSPS